MLTFDAFTAYSDQSDGTVAELKTDDGSIVYLPSYVAYELEETAGLIRQTGERHDMIFGANRHDKLPAHVFEYESAL